ncbi:unnamed protein product [Lepeophtheirus salmonis]|uniref:(salmon louse) hypothetical protein n=1 Tax=Lepeophtheirus salmonis TaxID=72036 RepID=A0A7R8CSY2_LEPSM|nr:unnamed protein product [Lepeophtheirus salmonis]CAF2920697.1 unnamed protein product [Lepeophtheirus salmonis]
MLIGNWKRQFLDKILLLATASSQLKLELNMNSPEVTRSNITLLWGMAHESKCKSTNGARQIIIRQSPANKIPSEAAESVKAHISSIDTIESHNCWATTKPTRAEDRRNKIFCTSMIHFLTASTYITTIEHKYFKPVQSHMESDSMHSAIQRSFKNKNVDFPSGYVQHIISARSNIPNTVVEITHEDILDFKMLNDRSIKSESFSGIINTQTTKSISNRTRSNGGSETCSESGSESIPLNKEKKKADIHELLPFCTSRQMAILFYNSLKCENWKIQDCSENKKFRTGL